MKFNTVNKDLNNLPVTTDECKQKIKRTVASATITSEALFGGKRELLIQHAKESYRLRITNQGKLILTK